MENERPNYYAIIPAEVRYDDDLKANAKLLYGEITALTYKTGVCYASNNYFARLYKVDPSAISKWVKNLEDKEYIEVNYIKEKNVIKQREIKINGIAKCQYVLPKDGEGYCQKHKENNTSINNINNKEKINKKERNEDIESVLRYLNLTLGTKYRNCPSTVRHINARLDEGYTIDDFFNVIDNKYEEWKDTDMEKYLRPDTLFGTKFDIYLNQKKR